MKLLLILISLFLLPYCLITFDGLHNEEIPKSEEMTYGIIYGNKVGMTGEPSNRLKARLDAGYGLYEDNIVDKLIVSGGIGIEGFDEAEVMKNYLSEQGVGKEDLLVDNDGYTTRQTSENMYEIVGERVVVIGISQWFHISRVKLSLRQSGFTNIHGYAPKYFEWRDIYSIVREYPAYIKYLLVG